MRRLKFNISFLHHLSLSYLGGGEKWIANVSNELSKRGHNVSIFALPILLDGKPKAKPESLLQGPTYQEGKHFKVKSDVCYATYNPLSFLTFQASHPRIAGIHAQSYWAKANLRYGLYPFVAKTVYSLIGGLDLRGFDAVHMVTDAYHVHHRRVLYVPNFVDSTKYEVCPKHGKFTVSFFSRCNWQKGYDLALAVRDKLKGIVNFQFSEGQVPESDMPMFIGASHVAIVPSRVDTFGLSIVEALMCGVPTVTTSLLPHIRLGLPIQYADTVEDYVRVILWYRQLWLEYPDSYNALCETIRFEAMRKYSMPSVMNQIESMFKEVAA